MKPKLTLRDLFWLVLVCAMGLGWWLNYRETCALRDKASDLEASLKLTERHNLEMWETTSQLVDAIESKGYIAVANAKGGMRLEPLDDEPSP